MYTEQELFNGDVWLVSGDVGLFSGDLGPFSGYAGLSTGCLVHTSDGDSGDD